MGKSSRKQQPSQSVSSSDHNHTASVASTTLNDDYTEADNSTIQHGASFSHQANGILDRMFHSCQHDPRGSVHRAWGISLLFVLFYFAIAIAEMVQLQSNGGSVALVFASIWTGIVHLVLAILGTFVLRRFPTSFSIGFLLGVIVVLANQNLILFATFAKYGRGSTKTNHAFAGLGFALCAVLTFVALLLGHFKQDIVMAPINDTRTIKEADSATMDGSQSYSLNMA